MADDRVSLLRRWLMGGDRPHHMIAVDASGKETEVPVKFNDAWIEMARSLDAFDPATVRCVDERGALLRATSLAALCKDDPKEEEAPRTYGNMSSSEQMLCTFGQLLADAYKTSNEVAWNTAFSKMVEIVDIFAKRSEALENRLARMEATFSRTAAEQLRAAQDGSEGSLLSEMIGAYLSGAAQAAAGSAGANTGGGPTNGKGAQV